MGLKLAGWLKIWLARCGISNFHYVANDEGSHEDVDEEVWDESCNEEGNNEESHEEESHEDEQDCVRKVCEGAGLEGRPGEDCGWSPPEPDHEEQAGQGGCGSQEGAGNHRVRGTQRKDSAGPSPVCEGQGELCSLSAPLLKFHFLAVTWWSRATAFPA